MCGFGSSGGSARQQDPTYYQNIENQRQNNIRMGMESVANTFDPQFNDDYYKEYERKYIAQAQPDLNRQQKDANREAKFQLSRQGLTGSSAAGKVYGDIVDTRVRADQAVADDARLAKEDQRRQVEGMRSDVEAQIPDRAGDFGVNTMPEVDLSSLQSAVPRYSPVTNLFAEVTNKLALNEQMRRAGYPGLGFGFFSDPVEGSKKSVQTIS